MGLLENDCGDLGPGFDERMARLASSAWQVNEGKGAVKYLSYEIAETDECGIDRAFLVELQLSPTGYTGRILSMAMERCTHLDCFAEYRVHGQ